MQQAEERGSSRAHCGIEIALLDERTGVFPFGAQTVSEITTAQESTDRNFTDTVRRSENDAVERGMSGAAAELVTFLAKS